MRNKNGFTLVEVLAVLVILAVLMVIAVPSVLTSVTTAKQRTFNEYITKVYTESDKTHTAEDAISTLPECKMYDLTSDFGLNDTGDFKGYVLVVKHGEDTEHFITMWNNDYMIYGISYENQFNTEEFQKNGLLEVDENSPELSKDKLAARGGCATYEDNTAERTVPDGTTPAMSLETPLFTGTKLGKNGWAAHYTDGTMDSCYNTKGEPVWEGTFYIQNGGENENFHWSNTGDTRNFCVSGAVAETKESAEANKSLECCTGQDGDFLTLYFQGIMYSHYLESSQASGYMKDSRGHGYFPLFGGGEMQATGVYE